MIRSLAGLLVVVVVCLCHPGKKAQDPPPRHHEDRRITRALLVDPRTRMSLEQSAMRVSPWQIGVRQLPQLVGRHRFNQGAEDDTGVNHGKVVGAQVVDSDRGRAMEFDGSNYVRIRHPQSIDITGPLTLAAWVKLSPKTRCNRNGENGQAYLVTKGRLCGSGVYRLMASTAQCPWGPKTFSFNIKTSDGEPYGHSVSATPESGNAFDDSWHHVAGTFDGTFLKLYIDGVLKKVNRIKGNVKIISRKCDMAIGGWGPTRYRMMRGLIDDVRIYNSSLSRHEIRMMAAIPAFSGPTLAENHPRI
jgi:hypothetical protein